VLRDAPNQAENFTFRCDEIESDLGGVWVQFDESVKVLGHNRGHTEIVLSRPWLAVGYFEIGLHKTGCYSTFQWYPELPEPSGFIPISALEFDLPVDHLEKSAALKGERAAIRR
jgi:hypothetical protein